jgi:hypothetical protein
MKIVPDHSLRPLYLFLVAGALHVIWVAFKWPWLIVIKTLYLLCAAYALTNLYLIRRERKRKETLKEEIRELSDDLTLRGDYTVDDFDLLYEAGDLERISSTLKTMPDGQRKLQAAVDQLDL